MIIHLSSISFVLFIVQGCAKPGAASASNSGFDVSAALSEVVPTVVTVTWTSDHAPLDEAWVEFGLTETYGTRVAANLANSPASAVLFGLKPSSDYHFRVTGAAGGEPVTSDDQVITTGDAPADFPRPSVDGGDGTVLSGGFLVTSVYTAPPAAVILDNEGDYVWWYEPDDPNFQVSRARLSQDGASVLFWTENVRPGGAPEVLYRVKVDGSGLTGTSLPDGHHDFLERTDGIVAYLEFDRRDVDGSTVEGDRLMELAPDGTISQVYDVWDDFDTSRPSYAEPGESWSHANSLSWLPDEDAYLVTFLGFNSIFKIDRLTGTLLWQFGGDESDFVDAEGSSDLLNRPHHCSPVDGGILVFENGDPERNSSRILEYTLDEEAGFADVVWSYTPDPTVFTYSLGDAQRLPDGSTLANFAMQGQLDLVDSDGQRTSRLNMSLGGAFGYSEWMEVLRGTE